MAPQMAQIGKLETRLLDLRTTLPDWGFESGEIDVSPLSVER